MTNCQNRNPNKINTSQTIHGVFLDICNWGALLVGPSGIGKSELALNLIQQGHRLIADDSVEFFLDTNNNLVGKCPTVLQDFLAVPYLGVINIRRLFGEASICQHQALKLVIELTKNHPPNSHPLTGTLTTVSILEIPVPQIEMQMTTSSNLITLITTAVRNLQLQETGYNATTEFIERQQQLLQGKIL